MPYLIEPSHQFVSIRGGRCSVEGLTHAASMTLEARRD
jgi:hypothetical protein